MKVILLKDIRKLGKKDDVVEVSDGYARNFLFKNKSAIAYTKGSAKVLDKQMEERAEHEAELKKEAEALSETLKGITLEFTLSTGKNGATFGSVSTCVVSSTGLVVTIVFVSSVLLISSFSSSSFLNGL